MRIVDNECVDCDMPCIGNACKYYRVVRLYCDECGREEQLYDFDGEELCIKCIEKRLDPVLID